jgi:hypothetical protein
MSYEDLVEVQIKRDAKCADAGGARRGAKRKGSVVKPAAARRSRRNELEDARREIETSGLGEYCSILQL